MKKMFFILIILCFCPFFMACSNENEGLTIYQIKIKYDSENNTAECFERVEYTNLTGENIEYISLNLYPNAFREWSNVKVVTNALNSKAYPNGESYGYIEIDNVKINSQEIEFEIAGEDENILRIPMELNCGERGAFEIEFNLQLPNINHRFGYGENTINFGNFYPIICVYDDGFCEYLYTTNGDPFYSDVANYEVEIKCDKKYKIASSGEVKNMEENTTKIIANKVRDFAFVLSEKFNVIEEEYEDVNIKYFYYEDKNPEMSLNTAVTAVKTFSTLFGEYPYTTYSVAQSNFIYGGMEYPNLVLISDTIKNHNDYEYVIVHETAHQWWYGVVGNDEYSEAWIDEGLAEYSCLLFYDKNPQYALNYDNMIEISTENYKHFVSVYSKIYKNFDTSMDRNLSEFRTEPEYTNLVYTKGILMFDEIKKCVGKRKFLRALQKYYKEFSYKNVSSEEVVLFFSQNVNLDVKGIFKSYIEGKVVII